MTTDNLGELAERIGQLARVPTLLVACDYDGTLAPFTDNPMEARPNRVSVAALRSLAEQANTQVSIISGRALRDLATLSRLPEEIRLVGSHGSEFDLGFARELDPATVELRHRLVDQVKAVAQRHRGLVEEKPTGITFHFRAMQEADAEAAREELIRGPASEDGVHVRNGHRIMELSVIKTNKGKALQSIRHRVGASAVLFIGDDRTDEDAFRTLRGPDVGVKVGDGPTAADYRVDDPDRVAQLLALLGELRRRWLRGDGLTPIEDHSILSDLRTVAVVAPDSSVGWLCLPRIDSAAVFGQLLGGRAAGHFTLRGGDDADEAPMDQRYVERSMALESRFPDFTVTDFLDISSGQAGQLADRSSLVRRLRGQGPVTIEFAPRLDFGRASTRLTAGPDGIVVEGTADPLCLRAPDVAWEIVSEGRHQTAIGRVRLQPDDEVVLELRSGTENLEPANRPTADRLERTNREWSGWVDDLELPRAVPDLVARSAIAIRALHHGPTGAFVAAATTGLPQVLGGVRNWDHRYCFLRDAALAATALVRLGSVTEALDYLEWVRRLLETRSSPERLAPLYSVTGRHLPPEAEIADLPGYGGSRPVRVGNGAESQTQLDGFGFQVDLVHHLAARGVDLSVDHWKLVEDMVMAVSRRWQQPDHGVWQSRQQPRHHLHSRVLCWVAVDRAIALAHRFLDRAPRAWTELATTMSDEILERGWNHDLGAFTGAYDSVEADASALVVGLSGLLPPTDDRFVATVEVVEQQLLVGPTVLRNRDDDGQPGRQGGVHVATSMLIDALCLVGRQDRAAELFSGLCDLAGGTGLLSEGHDPDSGRALGNLPHLRAHVGLIGNAISLDGHL